MHGCDRHGRTNSFDHSRESAETTSRFSRLRHGFQRSQIAMTTETCAKLTLFPKPLLCRLVEAQDMPVHASHCGDLISTKSKKKKKTHNRAFNAIICIEILKVTFPWTSYLIGPSSSAPKAINLDTLVFISVTVKDRSEE